MHVIVCFLRSVIGYIDSNKRGQISCLNLGYAIQTDSDFEASSVPFNSSVVRQRYHCSDVQSQLLRYCRNHVFDNVSVLLHENLLDTQSPSQNASRTKYSPRNFEQS